MAFSAIKVAKHISENGKLCPGESFIYHFMLGCCSKIGSTFEVKQRKKDLNILQISSEKLVIKFSSNIHSWGLVEVTVVIESIRSNDAKDLVILPIFISSLVSSVTTMENLS